MKLVFDIETYINYTLFAFMDIETDKVYTIELRNDDTFSKTKKLKKLLTNNTIITFNGKKFDEPITAYAMTNRTPKDIYNAVQQIIEDKVHAFQFYRTNKLRPFIPEHIDIMDVAMGIASLKLYGARLGIETIQDLPYEPSSHLTESEMEDVRDYCKNDLKLTKALYEKLQPDLELRADLGVEYNLDLMSDNGAKIAEKILIQECKYIGKAPSVPEFIYYTPPKYIKFKTKMMKDMFNYIKNHKFLLIGSGNITLPAKMKNTILKFDDIDIQMGIGGVHGSVENTSIYTDPSTTILDIDYKALYPSMMIANGFIPEHLGAKFMKIYKGMYDTRVQVKSDMKLLEYNSNEYNKLNIQQNGLKLINNSSFGKLGLKYSKMYDPSALLHITLTGQLTLMMVIEKLHLKGFKVFYANTDGITLKVKTKDVDKVKNITAKFDKKTGLEMEYEEFRSCHIRDVNNFVNITSDGKVKAKGAYGKPSLNKNSQTPIVFKAIRDFLQSYIPIKKTINTCKNVNDFCSSVTVRGGAMYSQEIPELYPPDWEEKLNSKRGLTKKIISEREKLEALWVKDKGSYLGKVVRWYYSTKGSSIHYKKNGNKVPKTDGAKPMMTLKKKLPKDLDYSWYYDEANSNLSDLGWSHDN